MDPVPYRRTFLVLEDNADDAILIRRAFTNSVCRVFVCRNTSEARAYLLGAGMYGDRERFPFPEVFVTDLRLGEESGAKFVGWLRAQEHLKDLPVIVLSGSVTPQDAATVKRLGVERIIEKPSDALKMERLLVGVSGELCGRARAKEERREWAGSYRN